MEDCGQWARRRGTKGIQGCVGEKVGAPGAKHRQVLREFCWEGNIDTGKQLEGRGAQGRSFSKKGDPAIGLCADSSDPTGGKFADAGCVGQGHRGQGQWPGAESARLDPGQGWGCGGCITGVKGGK